MEIFSWMMTMLAVAGTFLVIRRRMSGLYLWLTANAGLVVVNYHAGMSAQTVLFAVYIATTAYGIWEWKRSP